MTGTAEPERKADLEAAGATAHKTGSIGLAHGLTMSQNGCNSCHEIESESLVDLGAEVRFPDQVHGLPEALQKGGGMTHITRLRMTA